MHVFLICRRGEFHVSSHIVEQSYCPGCLKFDASTFLRALTRGKKRQDSGYCQHQTYGETITFFCPKTCDRCPKIDRGEVEGT